MVMELVAKFATAAETPATDVDQLDAMEMATETETAVLAVAMEMATVMVATAQ